MTSTCNWHGRYSLYLDEVFKCVFDMIIPKQTLSKSIVSYITVHSDELNQHEHAYLKRFLLETRPYEEQTCQSNWETLLIGTEGKVDQFTGGYTWFHHLVIR